MLLETLDLDCKLHKTWVPVLWACERAEQARKEGFVSDMGQRAIMGEVLTLRGCCGSLMGWNEYNVPLVYTQVTTLFFILCTVSSDRLLPFLYL